MLVLLIKLIVAHLIGDFVIQPKSWVVSKEKNKIKSKYLYAHVFVHLLALLVLLQFNMSYLLGIILIVITHLLIDLFKLYTNDMIPKQKRALFFIDQLLHLLVILFVINIYYPEVSFLDKLYSPQMLLLIGFLIFTSSTANIILSVILSKWNMVSILEKEENKLDSIPSQSKKEKKAEGSLANAGMYIGMLERLFIFFLVIFNQPMGVGLLITAKSVFRYNDLTRAKDRKLTEYVLIGSMLSFGLAIFSGIAYKYLIKML